MVDSIRGKGGHVTRDVLKTTIGKSEVAFSFAQSAASEFGLIEVKGKDYSLSPLGSKLSSAKENERKEIIRDIILTYQPYHTMLLRLKNSPNSSFSKSELTKAWFELNRAGTDRTREQYTASFGNICEWSGIIENHKKTIVLRDEANALLEAKIPSIPPNPSSTPPPKEPPGRNEPQNPPVLNPVVSIPLNATISISISVDTKEQTSVDNLLRIIKALRGESVIAS